MSINDWISHNYIEIFGAATGILYVFLEIRQNIWLWPVGIITSAVYIWIFFTGKIYADMSLQVYYLVISILGWYWWVKGTGHGARGTEHGAKGMGHRAQEVGKNAGKAGDGEQWPDAGKIHSRESLSRDSGRQGVGYQRDVKTDKFTETSDKLVVTRLKLRTGIILLIVFIFLFTLMWQFLGRLTDSPVPGRDAFITSLSIIATWMLARKIYEHWYLWIAVNTASVILFIARGLYPTVLLYMVYCTMSFVGLRAWKHTIRK